MPQNNPLVSVCIPSYNSGRYIQDTIRSVLDQTYTHFELIICDDASTDDTVEKVKIFKDERIRLIENKKNNGLTYNWNASVAHASGEFVKLLCSDDLLDADCLEKQIAVLVKPENDDVALVSCAATIIDHQNNKLFDRKLFVKSGRNSTKSVLRKTAILGTNIIGEPMVGLFRRSVLENCRYNGDNPYLIDLDFWVQVLEHGSLYCINESLASFRISGESLSASLHVKQYRLFCSFIAQLIKQKKLAWPYLLTSCCSAFALAIVRNLVFIKVKRKIKSQNR